MPSPYRPAASATAGFGAEIFLDRAIFASRRGVPLKKTNSVCVLSNFAPQGIPPGHFAPSPVVPAGKLYTTPTMLSSGEGLKKSNFVWIMLNCRGPAGSTLAAIHYLRFFNFQFSIFNSSSSPSPSPPILPSGDFCLCPVYSVTNVTGFYPARSKSFACRKRLKSKAAPRG